MNEKGITGNKKFWHTVKPFLSDKVKSRETITFGNNGNIEFNESEVAKTFNDFFSNIVKNLKIKENQCEDNLHSRFYPVTQLYKLYWSIGITQALTTFGIPHKGSQAFVFHMSIQILYSKKSEDWVLRKLSRKRCPRQNFERKCRIFCGTYMPSIQWSYLFIRISCNFQICKCNTCFQIRYQKSKR